MMFALPALSVWLYSCLSQTTGPRLTTLIWGKPPPAQVPFIHVANALPKTSSATSSGTCFDASFCTEKLTQGVGQKIGMPQSSGSAGVQAFPVPTPGQLVVLQNAAASRAPPTIARPASAAAMTIPDLRSA